MAMKNSLDNSPGCTSFFYGLLLDESRLKKETLYQNRKRWMLNRLVLGTGVVCGLGVDVDPQNSGMILVIQPGVALDGLGREVVVPAPVSVNPFLLTDSSGNPSGTADREKGNFDAFDSGAEPALALRSSLTPIRGGDYGQFLPLRGTFREVFATAFANCFSNSR
jgi:hypothetical protein